MKQKYNQDYIDRREKWFKECWSYITKADYKKARDHAKKGLKKFPNDTEATFYYYSILADYSLSKKTKQFKRMHAQAVKGMEDALRRPTDVTPKTLYRMKNEFFFQTQQYKKQYNLGISTVKKTKELNPYYSAGVGAAHYGLGLALKNKRKSAQAWAEKSVSAWNNYFQFEKKYYNPYVHLAIAYGVLGDNKNMIKSLKKSSRLCQKSMDYEEFAWVITTVSQIPYLQKKNN